MSRLMSVLLISAALFSLNAFSAPRHTRASSGSEEHPFGLGVMIGAPTAFVAKYNVDHKVAIDAGLGAFFGSYTLVYADYLLKYPGVFGHDSAFASQLIPYFGVGPIVAFTTSSYDNNWNLRGKSSGDIGLGIRVPGGIEWRPQEPSIGVFVELAPGVSLVPQVGIFLQAGIGIRYYF